MSWLRSRCRSAAYCHCEGAVGRRGRNGLRYGVLVTAVRVCPRAASKSLTKTYACELVI
jgi:hypothetical protein